MSRKRRYYNRGYQHICQISVDKGLLFCTDEDKLLLYTLVATRTRKYGVRIIAFTIMLNHFHIEAEFLSLRHMEMFMWDVTKAFARKYNNQYGLKGKVFRKPFNSAPKVKESSVVSNYIYIMNNAREKLEVARSYDYRWNFLRYCPGAEGAEHPFSEPFDYQMSSKEMKYLVRQVEGRFADCKPIDYSVFNSPRYRSLSERERLQLVDAIIVRYNVIDYAPILSKYGTVEKIGEILDFVSGSEHDVSDDHDREDYRHFYRMMEIAAEEGYDMRNSRYKGVRWDDETEKGNPELNGVMDGEARDPRMDKELYDRLSYRFVREAGATQYEINKFIR